MEPPRGTGPGGVAGSFDDLLMALPAGMGAGMGGRGGRGNGGSGVSLDRISSIEETRPHGNGSGSGSRGAGAGNML